ncbi:MocR-like pyridoxine biosynthesis transcription factor PdxR [Acinetobacter rathckeae]|uniref:MocR-like pyridoxine biosynthesis transcription factor PdxR n=1 Tax=Acinetobacter rathckeae TaxID=2605272 RepID=UPI0018A31683|nr:PLP-dependent aminotransferase family protein [Acinetobacter rathckeae]MBF7687139.1 PLP-dependent aminotransferase family protein [Acinetobacter rathckeae]MBF7694509.1 PLP-dependent aminotransferase family protein [Acinetobacter rathckeae]
MRYDIKLDLSHFNINNKHEMPLYRQLYYRFQEAIATENLKPGDRVPSVRSLANELNIAKGTIEQAYEMLVSEGYFTTHGAAGTIVSKQVSLIPKISKQTIIKSHEKNNFFSQGREIEISPFQIGIPAFDLFPNKTWNRLLKNNLHKLETTIMAKTDPNGYEPLRQEIANYLGISRGISCTAEQVFITTGYSATLQLICHTLLKHGDLGWYEDPGYPFARKLLEHSGMRLLPVHVESDGLDISLGKKIGLNARFAVVTPTHQSPSGVTLSLAKRLELLEWATQQNSWIIEDDYDSEFKYHGRPLPALKSLDINDRVLYAGTFSKVIFPGLRLAYLVVPKSQVSQFQYSASYCRVLGSTLYEATTADFMNQGYFLRHLQKMRSSYALRYDYVKKALIELEDDLQIKPQIGGIQILAHLKHNMNDIKIAMKAKSHGLSIEPLSNWYIKNSSSKPGLILGFNNFSTIKETENAVARLALSIRS